MQEVPEAGAVGPNAGGARTKTEIFRDRMKELKDAEAAKASEPEPEVPTEAEVSAAAAVPEEPKKKKGCMGMILLATGIGIAGTALAHFNHWV